MNPVVGILHEGVDIVNWVVSYNRQQQICTGVGVFNLSVVEDCGRTFTVWDTIKLYEDGIQKGIYNILSVSLSEDQGTYTIECQDNSIKLADYFVSEVTTTEEKTHCREWIAKYTNDATVSAEFRESGNGSPVMIDTTFGLQSAFDIITTLIQQSEWYMYIDNDGTAVYGGLHLNAGTVDQVFDDRSIISLYNNKSDKQLRNRAVVWGNSTEDGGWIFSDQSRHTPWNRDTDDKRAVVLANSSIESQADAHYMAGKMLDTFANINDEITIQIAGACDVEVGNVIFISMPQYTGTGIVTTIGSAIGGGKSGLITTITINERCPRLFGYFTYDSGGEPGEAPDVYVATLGQGVWKKPFSTNIWENFSTGLEDLNVIDLYISNGNFVCVAGRYAYTRTLVSSTWTKLDHGDFWDAEHTWHLWHGDDQIYAIACAINSITNEIYVGYGVTGYIYGEGVELVSRGWIGRIPSVNAHNLFDYRPIILLSSYMVTLYDIDTDDRYTYLTAQTATYKSKGMCGDYFWTGGQDVDYTDAYSVPYWSFCTAPVICESKAYYFRNKTILDPEHPPSPPYDETLIFLEEYDFNLLPPVITRHSEFRLADVGVAAFDHITIGPDGYSLYFIDGGYVKKYNILGDTFTTLGLGPSKLHPNQDGRWLWNVTVAVGLTTVYWFDMWTQTEATLEGILPVFGWGTTISATNWNWSGRKLCIVSLVSGWTQEYTDWWDNCTDGCKVDEQNYSKTWAVYEPLVQTCILGEDTITLEIEPPSLMLTSVTSHAGAFKFELIGPTAQPDTGMLGTGFMWIGEAQLYDDGLWWTCNPPSCNCGLGCDCALCQPIGLISTPLYNGSYEWKVGASEINQRNISSTVGYIFGRFEFGGQFVFDEIAHPYGTAASFKFGCSDDTPPNCLSLRYNEYAFAPSSNKNIYDITYWNPGGGISGEVHLTCYAPPHPPPGDGINPPPSVIAWQNLLLDTLSWPAYEVIYGGPGYKENIVWWKTRQGTGQPGHEYQYKLSFIVFPRTWVEVNFNVTAVYNFDLIETTVIDSHTSPHKLEVSLSSPIVTYSRGGETDNLRVSSTVSSGIEFIWPSGLPLSSGYYIGSDFLSPPVGKVPNSIYDLRVFNNPEGGISTVSGLTISGNLANGLIYPPSPVYIIISNGETTRIIDTSFGEEWTNITVLDNDIITHIETANSYNDWWLFLSNNKTAVSGESIILSGQEFYHNFPGETYLPYNTNLPTSGITSIRIDDRI